MNRDLVNQLLEDRAKGKALAYCRLVETRGSTPQKAGAMMLVFPDGSQAGTLGGGCVEAEVKRQALAVLAGGEPEVTAFQLDSDYGWDDGLICGGRMQILVEPLSEGPPSGYFQQLGRLTSEGQGGTEVVVFDPSASGLPAAASYLLDEQDRLVATQRGETVGGDIPPPIREYLKPLATRPRPYAARGIGYLPLLPRCRLLIVGGGHVGQAVGQLAADLDFDVWVVDDRQQYITEQRFPKAGRRITGAIGQTLTDIPVTPDTYCLIVTRGHNHDQEALYQLVDRGARYVGLIGSKRKLRLIFDNLAGEGISAKSLSRVFAPVGLDIGSQTVQEIAISIAAELVAHRNLDGQVPGRPSPVSAAASS